MVNDRGEYIAVDLAVYMPYAVYNLTHALVAPQHRKLLFSVIKAAAANEKNVCDSCLDSYKTA